MRELMGLEGKEVRNRVRIEPEASRSDQHQLMEAPWSERCHPRCDHAAQRVTDKVRAVELQSLHNVPAVQREVEHVFEQFFPSGLAEPRPFGREHAIVARKRVEERVLPEKATRPVKK